MEYCAKVALIFFLINCFSFYYGEAKKKNKFIINYKSGVTVCPDADSQAFTETSRLRAIRYNETTAVLEGKFELKKKLEGLVRLKCVLEKITPLGTKEEMGSYEIEDYCAEVKNREQKTMAGQYMRAVDIPPECPIEAGEYYIDNMVADTKDIPLNTLLVGVYTLTFTFSTYESTDSALNVDSTNEKFLGCLFFDMSVEEV